MRPGSAPDPGNAGQIRYFPKFYCTLQGSSLVAHKSIAINYSSHQVNKEPSQTTVASWMILDIRYHMTSYGELPNIWLIHGNNLR